MTAGAVATAGSLTPADLAAVPAEAPAMLRGAQRVLTVCHENPEADALGSARGVALLGEARGPLAHAGTDPARIRRVRRTAPSRPSGW